MTSPRDASEYRHWAPIRLFREDGDVMVDWCETGDVRFVEPFFHQTVERVLSRPAASLLRRQTPVSVLESVAEVDPGLCPSGFVFHTSRCGSTMLSQALAASARNRVLSEPVPVDNVLRLGITSPVVDEHVRAGWLRAVISTLGRARAPESRFFVKFQAWHVLALPVIRLAFPDVPFVFCFREPVEVLVSQTRSPGSDFVVGPLPPELYGLDLPTAAQLPPSIYAAQVLHTYLSVLAGSADASCLFVDYRELREELDRILAHFGVVTDESERLAMQSAFEFDAKVPGRQFVPDSRTKRAEANEELRAAAELIAPSYNELLELARARSLARSA